MDIDYGEVIDFSKLKVCIAKKRTTMKYLAEDTGIDKTRLSQIARGITFPMTDAVAKICSVLKVNPSEIVEFKGIEPTKMQEEWFETHERKYDPARLNGYVFCGELTYEPLWEMLEGFVNTVNDKLGNDEKTVSDILDTIEPYRRRNGIGEEAIKKALEANGYGEGYEAKRKRTEKGLPTITRTKLKNNRPVSLRTVYDICKKLGCSIDWVLSYR